MQINRDNLNYINRAIFFDAGKMHCSTTTTDAQARFNIIVNYLGVDE